MTRYMRSSRRSTKPAQQPTPPIWRGIGCLLVLIVPVMAWVLAFATVEWARTSPWQLPYQLMGYVVLPPILWKIPYLPPVLAFIERQPHLYMTILIAVLFVVAFSALLSVVYSIAYRMLGPSHLGPYDVPQPQIKVGRYKR